MTAKLNCLVFSRNPISGGGGLEGFNRNFMRLLSPITNLYIASEWTSNVYLSYGARLLKTLAASTSIRPEFVFIQYGSFLDILSLPILKLTGVPLVVIAHVSSSWAHLRSPFLRRITILLLKTLVHRLLVLSEDQKRVFYGVEAHKVHTIISPEFASVDAAPSARDGFLFIGRIAAEKGIFDVIRAWAELRAAGKEMPLKIVGAGDKKTIEDVQALVREHRLTDVVSIHPPIQAPSEVARLMETVKGVVYPSYKDAFPLVMLESFSRGTPCIVSTAGESPSYVSNEHLVVRPGDVSAIATAVARVADDQIDRDYLSTMKSRSRLFASGQIVKDMTTLGLIS